MKSGIFLPTALLVMQSTAWGQGNPQRFQGPASQRHVDTVTKMVQAAGSVCPDSSVAVYKSMDLNSSHQCYRLPVKGKMKTMPNDEWASVTLSPPLHGGGFVSARDGLLITQDQPHSTRRIVIGKETPGAKPKVKVGTVFVSHTDTVRVQGELRYVDRYTTHTDTVWEYATAKQGRSCGKLCVAGIVLGTVALAAGGVALAHNLHKHCSSSSASSAAGASAAAASSASCSSSSSSSTSSTRITLLRFAIP